MKLKYLLMGWLILSGGSLFAQQANLVKYVNTLQGTNSNWGLSYGNTYPTIAMPFPVHSWSPQTGKNGDGWKYTYNAKTIRGFQQVHQCSPWMGDYAVFSLMPVKGKLAVQEEERATAFSHANEIAKPHYYRVKFDNQITAEISPVERGGHMRFSFPRQEDAYLVLDGYTKNSEVKIYPKERKIIGYVNNGLFVPKNFKCYFVLEFDQPFTAYGTWENRKGNISRGKSADEGEGVGAYVQFKKGAQVQVKIASSYISPEQAQLTLDRELGRFRNLDQTRAAAADTWNKLLGRARVEGGSEEDKATYYSCLFRANLFSHPFFEYGKDGKPYYFSPYDGKIHQGYMYTDNGFWDTFRAQFPLSNILHPTMQGRYMQSLLDAQEQGGWFPTWSNPGPSGVMVGNHAISLLTDAWAKGIRTFDPGKALEAYLHEITNKGPWGGSNGREPHREYFSLGYVPYPEYHESTAKTLEYAYDDFCGFALAKMSGNEHMAQVYARQMYNYRNVFDTKTGFVRGRMKNGEWLPNFDPIEWGGPFTEANSWQYSWSVFHNIEDLVGLMGGEEKFNAKLDAFFSMHSDFKVGTYRQTIHEMREMVLAKMGQYAHGNQPVQHAAYLYNYARQPWKSQKQVRAVMDRLYNATENGFPGDEDQGATSSWYVLSALGFYSVCPGTDQYVIGSPKFPKATITLENGKKFVVEALNNSPENVYIQSATLNGQPYTRNYIRYADIANGGLLRFVMGNKPALDRGIGDADKPFSLATHEKELSASIRLPAIIADSMVLQQQVEAPIWGWSAPGEKITVRGSWANNQAAETTADQAGKWIVKIKTPKAGGPYTLTIQGKEKLVLQGVLVGEVWLASGQSNMEMPVSGWNNEPVLGSAKEIQAARNPSIRLFTVKKDLALQAREDVTGIWASSSPQTAADFSATAYFFGRELQQKLKVPIGLIHSSWGGTVAEAWTSKTALKDLQDFNAEINRLDSIQTHLKQILHEDERKLKDWNQKVGNRQYVRESAAGWKSMTLPSTWEAAGLKNFDGLVWFKKTIEIPASWAGKDLKLDLGPIDDMDVTWFNEKEVGITDQEGSWFANRSYTVPGELVKAGENTITVRVADIMGDGGIYGGKELLRLYPADQMPAAGIPLAGNWLFKPDAAKPVPAFPSNPNQPAVLYNAMLAPLIPFAIKGAIWYQGESNVGRAAQYEKLFPAMIQDWRSRWQQGAFPFFYVQIAPFPYWGDSTQAAALRDAQRRSLQMANTGMVVTSDIGDLKTIHPSNKPAVGKRLSLWALANTYGVNKGAHSGPLYKTMRVEGNKIVLSFDHADGGLVAKGDLSNFQVAGADGRFMPAQATIKGENVIVQADAVAHPAAVRYGWFAQAEAQLFNKAGLPASSFNTLSSGY